MPPPRIVLDTASFISAVRSPSGAAGELLALFLRGAVTIVLDLKLYLEYQDVALRQDHLRAARSTPDQMIQLLRIILDRAEPAVGVGMLRPLSPDPNDDMVLELAVSASVQAIVTSNVRHFIQAAEPFGILVMTPGEFLQRLKKEPS